MQMIECIEYVYGIPCKVKKEKFPDGKWRFVYTFTVDGWSECTVTGRAATKRVINGRLDFAVRNAIGIATP